MKTFISLFVIELKQKRYNENFYEIISWCFAPKSALHKHHFKMTDESLTKH